MISASCEGVLKDNLEACMQKGIATSRVAIEATCNMDLPIVEGFATTPLSNSHEVLVKRLHEALND